MDSLLASYASSDEEEECLNSKPPSKHGGLLSSMPPPRLSLIGSLPPPKSQISPSPNPQPKFEQKQEYSFNDSNPKSSSSSLLASIPPPKSSSSSLLLGISPPKSSFSNSKRVVQFKPPTVLNPISGSVNDEGEEDDEGEKERKRKRSKESLSTPSAESFLSSILPAPRHSTSLGTLGTGRKSMFETVAPVYTGNIVGAKESDAVAQSDASSRDGFSVDQSHEKGYDYYNQSTGSENHGYYGGYVADHGDSVASVGVDDAGADSSNVGATEVQSGEISYDYTSFDRYIAGAVDYSYGDVHNVEYTNSDSSYVDYGNYNVQYENTWANGTAMPDVSKVVNELKLPRKRGRKDVVPEIIEVKQDELMKDRPRPDQVKSTGIAFGPAAYQPEASSKGKPTKLHKRKHQIGALYFDMRQKESELTERRSQGFQTKAQTQAKYGW